MRRPALILAAALLLLVIVVAASIYLATIREDDDLAPLADGLEPLTGNLAALLARGRSLVSARGDAVAASLQAQVPQTTPDRAGLIGACLAMWQHESNGWDPHAYNYYDSAGKLHGNQTWTDTPPTIVHAAGIAQHVKRFWAERGLTAENVWDLDANVGASLRKLNLTHWGRIMRGCPDASLHLRAALLYLGHGAGGVPMDAAIPTAAAGGDWAACVAASVAADPPSKGDPRRAKMWTVASNAPAYAARWGGA